MTLDISIIDSGKHIIDYLPLSDEQHHMIIQLARQYRLAQITKMQDYYGDVDYDFAEVKELHGELVYLQYNISELFSSSFVLRRLLELVERAVESGNSVSVIAD